MNRIAALTIAAAIALGTTGSVALTASHQTPANNTVKQAEWQVPSSVATVEIVPMDNIAPDKSYGTEQDAPPVALPVAETPVAIPAYVAPVYAAPKPVTVQGTPVVVGTEVKPAPVKTQAPVTVPSVPVVKPTPAPTCPPLLHKGGVNITPPNAPAYCVYAQ